METRWYILVRWVMKTTQNMAMQKDERTLGRETIDGLMRLNIHRLTCHTTSFGNSYSTPDGHQAPDINDRQTNDAIHEGIYHINCSM